MQRIRRSETESQVGEMWRTGETEMKMEVNDRRENRVTERVVSGLACWRVVKKDTCETVKKRMNDERQRWKCLRK